MKEYTIQVGEVFTEKKAKELEEYLRAKDVETGHDFELLKIQYHNLSQFLSATVWHLNNKDKDGNSTTKMNIPNVVYEVVGKKLAQLPSDRKLTESEALELARKK